MGKDNRNRSLFALQSDYGGATLFLEESAEIANMKMQYLAHKPHPFSIVKEKALKDIVDYLTENKLI